MSRGFIVAVLTLPLLVLGCASYRYSVIEVENRAPLPAANSGSFLAGAARADITPPPGLPMAGHSRNGGFARGVRTRLYARALYLKPKSGRPVALVQVDLLSGSRILHHRVAELVAPKTDIEAGGLVLAATHTHSAQGNFFGDAFYDRMASHVPGFQVRLYEFMAERIAGAVIGAYEARSPARIAAGSAAIEGVNRNRSLPAYRKNVEVQGTDPGERDAVNADLYMLRVDRVTPSGAAVPLGAFSSFSIHPNLTNRDTGMLYNGDVAAYVEREVERGIRRRYPDAKDPLHAIANQVNGDVTFDYGKKERLGYPAMRRVGSLIAGKALELFQSLGERMRDDPLIRYRAMEVDVYGERQLDGESLCEKPAAGQAALAGASDRPFKALSWLPGFAPGWPKRFRTDTCQGKKRIMGGALQHKVFPLQEYPHLLFLQAVQVDDMVLLPIPFEATTMAGRRIAERARRSAEKEGLPGAPRPVVVSTANGYWGYCTTPEEYALQYYEGGQTIYGPGTMGFLAAHAARLVADLPRGSGGNLPERWSFNVKIMKDYFPGPGNQDTTVEKSAMGEPGEVEAGRKSEEPFRYFRWRDFPPASIALHRPLVSVEESEDGETWRALAVGGVPVDDAGTDIAIIHCGTKKKEGHALYEARWYNPVMVEGRRYRFRIHPRRGQEPLYSQPFTAR